MLSGIIIQIRRIVEVVRWGLGGILTRSNSSTHDYVITVTCFLIGLLVGAWRILVIGRNQGEIMYSTLNTYDNGYDFMCPYWKPGLSAISIYETIQAPIL
jgi:hypothetical protein